MPHAEMLKRLFDGWKNRGKSEPRQRLHFLLADVIMWFVAVASSLANPRGCG
jgi:hypothetical protein